MEHRKPFNIDRCLLIYNGIQVCANLGILLRVSAPSGSSSIRQKN